MADQLSGHIDEYTRIEIFLPFKTQSEVTAGLRLIHHVQNARLTGQRYRYSGLTHTAQLPTVFQGAWWSKKQRKWVIDKLVILMLDLDIPYTDRQRVAQEADELKRLTDQSYAHAGAKQIDIWVVTYGIGHVP